MFLFEPFLKDAIKLTTTPTSFCRLVPDSTADESSSNQSETPSSSFAENEQIRNLKKRLQFNLQSLEACYFNIQVEPRGILSIWILHSFPSGSAMDDDTQVTGSLGPRLEQFSNVLTGISKYVKIRRLASLNYSIENFPNSSIVSR